jgi:hypothetical protein
MLRGDTRRYLVHHRNTVESRTKPVDEVHTPATSNHKAMGEALFDEPIAEDIGVLVIYGLFQQIHSPGLDRDPASRSSV